MNSFNINLIYDYLTPNGYLPNALNPNYLQTLVEKDFKFDHNTLDLFEKRYGAISNWHGEQVIEPLVRSTYTVSDLMDGFENCNNFVPDNNTYFLYVVTPFGGASASYGYDFTYNEKKSFFHFISENAKSLIREVPNVYLFINYSNEGTIDFNWWNILHDESKKFNIPLNKIIFCSSDYFTDLNYSIWKKMQEISEEENLKMLYLNWSLHSKARELFDIFKGRKTTFNKYANNCTIVAPEDVNFDVKRNNKFLMLNRRLRPHRLYSICLFNYKNILDQFLISYDLDTMQLFSIDDENIKMHIENDESLVKTIQSEYKILKQNNPKRFIDYTDLENVWGFNFENKDSYLQTYIHITSETNFFEIGGYLSEKTWKPIGHLQPFIFMGPAHGLTELKKLGFKTFSPFIDESYDNEMDPELRFKMIINEIERLSKVDITEIHDWYNSIFNDILVYNQQLLFSYADNKKSSSISLKQFKNLFYDNTTFQQ